MNEMVNVTSMYSELRHICLQVFKHYRVVSVK